MLLLSFQLQAQTLADIARAEKARQQAVEAAVKFEKQAEKEPESAQPLSVESNNKEKEAEKEITPEEKLQRERVDVLKKRAALLLRLEELRGDTEAMKSVELELMELTKRNEQLKLEHLETVEARKKETASETKP
jgi:hypothetical protein